VIVARFHPAASLVVWLFFIVQLAGASWAILLVVLGLMVLWAPLREGVLHSARRMRWLLLAVLVLSGWFVSGQPCLAGVAWSPSRAGVLSGLAQALRLLIMAASLRGLWLAYGQGGFMAGMQLLLRPLSLTGLPVARFSLRLVLTLQYAELLLSARPQLSLAWLSAQLAAEQGSQTVPDQVELGFYSWQGRDWWLLMVALVLAIIMKAVQ
jgi:energy-coupling factor transport system permease protein